MAMRGKVSSGRRARAAVVVAATLVVAGVSAAGAAALVTGKQVKDGSLPRTRRAHRG